MLQSQRSFVTSLVAVLGTASALAMAAPQRSRDGGQTPAPAAQGQPELPPGAVRLVNYSRHGAHLAICAEEPGPPTEQGDQLISRTRVWVDDGTGMRQVGMGLGTCDPAWSADGQRVAMVTPNGLWVLSPDLTLTTHLVDTRHSDAPGNESAHRTLSGPKWAPDGSRLAFLVSTRATSWVETVDAVTGSLVYSSDPETYEFDWGPDSQSLHFGARVVRLP